MQCLANASTPRYVKHEHQWPVGVLSSSADITSAVRGEQDLLWVPVYESHSGHSNPTQQECDIENKTGEVCAFPVLCLERSAGQPSLLLILCVPPDVVKQSHHNYFLLSQVSSLNSKLKVNLFPINVALFFTLPQISGK